MVQRLGLCKCLCVYQPSSTEELYICVLLMWRQASKQCDVGLAGAHPTAAYILVAGAAYTSPPKGHICVYGRHASTVRIGTHSARACLPAGTPARAFTCLRRPCAPDPVGRGWGELAPRGLCFAGAGVLAFSALFWHADMPGADRHMAFTAQRLRVSTHHFTGARGARRQPGVRRPRVSRALQHLQLQPGNVGLLRGHPQQLRPSSQMRSARIQPRRWLLANTPSSRAFTCRAQAMRA